MINFDNFYNYLNDLRALYLHTKSLKGMSEIARKHGVKAITKEQFFKFNLDAKPGTSEAFACINDDGTVNRGHSDAIRRDMSDLDRMRHGGNAVIRQKAESVFNDSLPGGYYDIKSLRNEDGSPYRYALKTEAAIDNADEYMCSQLYRKPGTAEAIERQLSDAAGEKSLRIWEYMEFAMPTLGCAERLSEYTIAFVKTDNNGDSFWLAEDKDILRLLAWIAFIAE